MLGEIKITLTYQLGSEGTTEIARPFQTQTMIAKSWLLLQFHLQYLDSYFKLLSNKRLGLSSERFDWRIFLHVFPTSIIAEKLT